MKRTTALSATSQRLFRQMTREYSIHDTGGREILRVGLRSLDAETKANEALAKDGPVLRDRWGQVKPHPAAAIARDARAGWLAALKALNLAVGAPVPLGRPEGS